MSNLRLKATHVLVNSFVTYQKCEITSTSQKFRETKTYVDQKSIKYK